MSASKSAQTIVNHAAARTCDAHPKRVTTPRNGRATLCAARQLDRGGARHAIAGYAPRRRPRSSSRGSPRRGGEPPPAAGGGDLDNRLQVRERLFAFGDDFWIENARGRRVYLVDGKALRVRDTLLFKDMQGQERYKLQEKVARVRDTMTLYNADGSTAATIKKALITPSARPLHGRPAGSGGSRNAGQHPAPRVHHRAGRSTRGVDLEELVPHSRHVRHRGRAGHDRSAAGRGHDRRHRHDARRRADRDICEGESAMESATTSLVGPIQLVVIGFPPDAQFRGEILRALADIRGRGVIRLIDALFVRKDAEGNIERLDARERPDPATQRELLGAIAGGLLGLMAGGDEESEALGADAGGASHRRRCLRSGHRRPAERQRPDSAGARGAGAADRAPVGARVEGRRARRRRRADHPGLPDPRSAAHGWRRAARGGRGRRHDRAGPGGAGRGDPVRAGDASKRPTRSSRPRWPKPRAC